MRASQDILGSSGKMEIMAQEAWRHSVAVSARDLARGVPLDSGERIWEDWVWMCVRQGLQRVIRAE